jgi:multiple sugar transport system permease protein
VAATTAITARALARPRRRLLTGQAIEGYLCIAPWLIGFVCFVAGPMMAALIISFTDWSMLSAPEWVGLGNYAKLFEDPLFYNVLFNTAFISFISVPLQLGLALLMAIGLNEKLKGLAFFRTIFFLPSQMPVVASALLWLWVFNPEFGLINAGLNTLNLPVFRWLFDPDLAKPSIVLITLWGGIGTPLIIFLAGLQGIPESLHEAAAIDGAGALARFRHVTLPMLSPIIFFNLIIGVVASFQAYFTLVFVTTGGGPGNATLIFILYIYFKAFRDFAMGYAAALAWLLFMIVVALTAINFGLARFWVHYEGGDAA